MPVIGQLRLILIADWLKLIEQRQLTTGQQVLVGGLGCFPSRLLGESWKCVILEKNPDVA